MHPASGGNACIIKRGSLSIIRAPVNSVTEKKKKKRQLLLELDNFEIKVFWSAPLDHEKEKRNVSGI